MSYIVEYKDLTGCLKDYPIEVVQRMVECVEEQGCWRTHLGLSVLRKYPSASGPGGFSWDDTVEGPSFWLNIISYKIFTEFFERYPIKHMNCTLYAVTDGHNNKEQLEKLQTHTRIKTCVGKSRICGAYYLDVRMARDTNIRFCVKGSKRYEDLMSNGINLDD